MLPISPNQSTQPSLASYIPKLASAFSDTQERADDLSESNVQIGNGFLNNLTIGNNNTANNHIHLAAADSKLIETLMLQHIFALQPNIKPLVNLDSAIEALQKRYEKSLEEDNEVKDALSNYVEPEGMELHDSTRFDLKSKVQDFLNSNKKVLLLLGEAGSGKSTFNRDLAVSLWEACIQGGKSENMPIPVFIGLSSLLGPDRNLVSAFFERHGFSKEQIKELQSKHRFVLILDGFDEIEHRQQVFYKDNELNDWKGAKIIISSRPEYLGPNYQYKFHPPGERTALQEYRLAPFSEETIKRYVDRYSEIHPDALWSAEKYKKELEEPSLKELVSNPFLLKITLSVLPELSQSGQIENQSLTRIAIYDQFVKSWFDRSQQRLDQILELNSKERDEFKKIERGGFANFGVEYSQELALEMYQAGEVIASYKASTYAKWKKNNSATEGDWRRRLLGDEETSTVLMRLNAPLICQDRPNDLGKEYRFIHKSLRDYFVAREMWQELESTAGSDASIGEPLNEMKNVQGLWKMLNDSDQVDQKGLLNRFNLVEDVAIQRFLVERVRQNKALMKPLLAWIKASKQVESVSQGAANAITILVKAGIQFNGMDLKGIRIPVADLSFGMFDSAQLQGSDLSGVKFSTSWLREANLSGAQMSGVQFGELAYLEEESGVNSCAYSPDGQTCTMSLSSGEICVYGTSSWTKSHTLKGHTGSVGIVVYSPRGEQIASGGMDNTVRLWDVKSGAPGPIFKGHTERVLSVVYSPSGEQIASGSGDRTVRLWDVKSGAPGLILKGHTDWVGSVVYSPSGSQLASCSDDYTVRLWDVRNGSPGPILKGHTDRVLSVVYSPSGEQIASGSRDKTVRLWDVKGGSPGPILKGHTGMVNSVVYSPSGEQIASGSGDLTVRLWDVKSGAPGLTLKGHTDFVGSVVYSPSGEQIASGSGDHTVRLWEVKSGAPGPTLKGHSNWINSVVYSPSGEQIASGSSDKTVRLWEVKSGAPGPILKGHTNWVNSVVYSPSGSQLASGSWDSTVRLWEVKSGAPGPTLRGHTRKVLSVAYSPNGEQVASGGMDNTVRLWDVKSGAPGPTLKGHFSYVRSVVYSPSGEQLASGSADETIRLWEVKSGAPGSILKGHTGYVNSVAYSPSGLQLASCGNDSTVRLWEVKSGAPGPILKGHTDYVNSVAYSPSGLQLASCGNDKTVRLWEVKSGAPSLTLTGHTRSVNSAVYSPSGEQIASGSEDKTVRLWEVISGACLREIQMLSGVVNSVAWTVLDGEEYLVTGSVDHSVRQWELKKELEGYQVKLCWSSVESKELTVKDTLIEEIEGLSEVNQRLLTQRGAVLAANSISGQ
ncbi:Myosin heavy-chain kinase [Mycoavidus cysteinexigens]|uniref:Myosin heavy-chain kinase n=3 Tax=Mycoavidus cysteinexigens TaxID=1553431 RepID=A0A2Z6EWF1_9BURK|nr:NACHT domain-containing protein [Mycoavidus cysteinexigens]BBE09761.1 Myosin heavy-chain kinase [Mycoavidus cysteinexigens]